MVSAVSSSSSVAATSAASAVAKIAELNKQASSLRQDLLRANHIPPSEDDVKNAELIQNEIVNVQQQIEQAVLEMQLSRLNVINATRNKANADGSGKGNDSGNNSEGNPQEPGDGDASATQATSGALATDGNSREPDSEGEDTSKRVRLAGAYQIDSPDKLVDEQA